MTTRSPLLPKVRRGLSLAASTTTALSLLLSGSAFTSMAANASEVPFTEINTEIKTSEARSSSATDRIIVKFSGTAKGNPTERGNAYGKIAKELGISVKEVKQTADGAQVIEANRFMSASEVSTAVSALKSHSSVEYAEGDALMQIASTPNDTLYPKQWDLSEAKGGINVPIVWDKTKGAGQVVAVIDSGITNHSELNANILPGYDMISDASWARDGNGRDANAQDEGDYRTSGDCNSTLTANSSWHGTHVAGTIVAAANNASGISGVAPEAKVVPVRTLGPCGGYNSDISDGIIWASGGTVAGVPANANPARVINLSVGGPPSCTYTMQNAINTAYNRGSAIIVSAGNSSTDASTFSPASCNNVITVGAINREGQKSSYSNYGSVVDISAAGGDSTYGGIASTYNSGTTTVGSESYAYMMGTSMAAPHVSGVAALMLAADPSLTPAEIENRMKSTAHALTTPCAEGCGAGVIDAAAAVIFPAPAPAPEPAPAPAPAPEPAPAPVTVTLSPVSSSTPTVSGTSKVGETLTTNPGTWGPEGVELTYQWKSAGTVIDGATSQTYQVTPSDLGKTLSVTVTGSKTGYTSKSETSTETAAAVKGTLTTTAASISGTVKAGYTLTANYAAWGPAPVTMSYRWLRDGVIISGATSKTYTLTGSDTGKKITVQVIGSKTGYTALYRSSAATATVAYGDLAGSFPKISGTTKAGYTLTATPGTWTSGVTLSYQWYRDGVLISGATASTYKLVDADRTHQIKVRVLGTKSGYTSRAYYSYSTVRIS